MSLGTATDGKVYPRIWKDVYEEGTYAVGVAPLEPVIWLGCDRNNTFLPRHIDGVLSVPSFSWHRKEIPYDQYRRELYRKVLYRRRRVSKASKFDEKLFDACIKLCNEHFFWNKDYNKETHSMQFLHQKTGATFDVSANEFITCPSPQAALELVETHHAIYNVTESGK